MYICMCECAILTNVQNTNINFIMKRQFYVEREQGKM